MTELALPEEEVEPMSSLARQDELTVEQVVAQVQKIQEVQRAVMKDGEHYGVIPGTNKPSLLKPGAEKLCETFRLAPRYTNIERTLSPEGHLDVFITCELTHIPSGLFVGEGLGACTTRESKYAYRQQERTCPACGAAAIIKGKAEYGGGWVCFKKKGGCGAKYADDNEVITQQKVGRVANEDLPDTWNTVVKIGKKRALVDAVLTATAASDIFTQDIEDSAAPAVVENDHADGKPTKADRDTLNDLLGKLGEFDGSKNWGHEADTFAQKTFGKPLTELGQEDLRKTTAALREFYEARDKGSAFVAPDAKDDVPF